MNDESVFNHFWFNDQDNEPNDAKTRNKALREKMINNFHLPIFQIVVFHAVEVNPETGSFEWWTSGIMLDPLFFLISRLNMACSPHVINLQINKPISIKDLPF